MRTIGVRELKAKLSAVLRDVQSGETVLVTDRGRVVAEMRAPGRDIPAQSRVERALARLSGSGDLRIAEQVREPYRASPVRAGAGTVQALIDDERGDR